MILNLVLDCLNRLMPSLGFCWPFAPAKTVDFELNHPIRSWITFNEPWCSTVLGFANGEMAPGKKARVLVKLQRFCPGLVVSEDQCFFFGGGRGGAAVGKPKEISVKLRNFELQLVSANANADRANHCFINRSIDTKHPRLCSKVNSCSTVTGETRHWAISCCAPHHPFTCPSSAWTKIYRI